MKAEIIAIGTELLLGQIANTNAQFISEQMAQLGIPVYQHHVVGDNAERLLEQVKISAARSDLLIFTGGLGPTKDDLTKEALAQLLHKQLVIDQPAMKKIEHIYQERKIVMTENNRRQALVFEGAHVLANDAGLAPGMAIEVDQTYYLLFPGPPKELYPMFTNYAIPYLRSLMPEQKVVYSKVMKFYGIGESALETKIMDLIDGQTNPTIAPLAKEGEVTLRITSLAQSNQEAEELMKDTIEEISKRVGEFQYGWDEDSLESVVIKQLRSQGLTLSTAESCTGGLISHMITSVEGASQAFNGGIVCYTNKVKQEQVGVPEKVLASEGAVSALTAQLLAEGIRTRTGADIGLSVTGVAGPAEQEGKPVGTIYIGVALPGKTEVKELTISGNRDMIQTRAAKQALYLVWNEIKKGE